MATLKPKPMDPDSPIQILHTKQHGDVKVDGKSWCDGPGVGTHIVRTPEGGYRHRTGAPIASLEEGLTAIPPGPDRDHFINWWNNKDSWQLNAPRKIGFEAGTGFPIYEDTGEYVEDEGPIQAYWPDGDILWAAIRGLWRRQGKLTAPSPEPRVTYETATGVAPTKPPATEEVSSRPPRLTNQGQNAVGKKRDNSKAVAAAKEAARVRRETKQAAAIAGAEANVQ